MGFHRSTVVTTRKQHQCRGCLAVHPKHTRMESFAGTFYGDFYYGYLCEQCATVLRDRRNDFSEGWYDGDLKGYWETQND